MTKPELGVKRDCPECGARFYDLGRTPAHCPKCAHSFVPEALLKPRKPRREDEPAVEKEVAKPETSLEEADKEAKAAKSKRKAGLDEDAGDEEELSEIEDIEDIDVEDDDNTLLEDDEDDDMTDIVSSGDDED